MINKTNKHTLRYWFSHGYYVRIGSNIICKSYKKFLDNMEYLRT